MDRLLEANEPLKGVSAALSDLVEESPHIAHLKDAQTKKMICANLNFVEKLGLEQNEDIMGLTVNDFCTREDIWGAKKFSAAFSEWKKAQPALYEKYDQQVIHTKRCLSDQTTFFTNEGLILTQHMLKKPVLNEDNNKVIAIYTYNYETTFQRSLSDLFELYQKYYQEEDAIQNLLKHLDIDSYFTDLPTRHEMQVLFAMHQDICPEQTQTENIFTRELALRDKVTAGYWHEMLTRLRAVPVHGASE
ncbi:hypothetical protein [Candidatus Glomeribacter gigasporarum]|uniref:hypothetical protein n=1 Tax=Candidatus Glomeribacter gigasporarum TaxID=132144 RepID=UPI00131599BE|nr:hypothetical protein [Candidatus Glomeribacter gigasporarum]